MERMRILVVEDDQDLGLVISDALETAGFTTLLTPTGKEALEAAHSEEFSLFLLDMNLPDINGKDICRSLKQNFPSVPIVFLTARDSEAEVVAGLELGADDYIRKPASPAEVVARIRARLREGIAARVNPDAFKTERNRTTSSADEDMLQVGYLSIDLKRKRLLREGESVELTAFEFDLLAYLASNAGIPIDREQILEHVWGTTIENYQPNVNVLVCRLRKKIEVNPLQPRYLITVRGRGYRFAESQEFSDPKC